MSKQKQKKARRSSKDFQPCPWFPKPIDRKLIPAITSLGKRGFDVVSSQDSFTVKYRMKHPMTAEERHAIDVVPSRILFPLAAALYQGPKLFVLPPELIDHLDKIDLPIAAEDFSPPFQTCIVKSRDSYQIITQTDRLLACSAFRSDSSIVCLYMRPDDQIETRLSTPSKIVAEEIEGGGYRLSQTDENYLGPQHFRATLNFLLLATKGGFARSKRTAPQRRNKKTPPQNSTRPEVYELQNIKLWQQRLENGTKIPEPEPADDSELVIGKKKRIHWRRAHWRRVAIGQGRINRELRLIEATLVNKALAPDDLDISKTEYRAE